MGLLRCKQRVPVESGHSGYLGTYQRAKSHFYCLGVKSKMKAFIASCDTCQRNKGENTQPAGLLQPLPILDKAWQHLTMDFVDKLPKSEGKEVIFVVVDRFTKYSHFIGLSHPFTAYHVAKAFMYQIY